MELFRVSPRNQYFYNYVHLFEFWCSGCLPCNQYFSIKQNDLFNCSWVFASKAKVDYIIPFKVKFLVFTLESEICHSFSDVNTSSSRVYRGFALDPIVCDLFTTLAVRFGIRYLINHSHIFKFSILGWSPCNWKLALSSPLVQAFR